MYTCACQRDILLLNNESNDMTFVIFLHENIFMSFWASAIVIHNPTLIEYLTFNVLFHFSSFFLQKSTRHNFCSKNQKYLIGEHKQKSFSALHNKPFECVCVCLHCNCSQYLHFILPTFVWHLTTHTIRLCAHWNFEIEKWIEKWGEKMKQNVERWSAI